LSGLIQHNSPAFMGFLSKQQRISVIEAAHIAKYSDGQLIHSRGEIKPGLSIVKSGSANVGVYGADGKFVMVAVLGPGESFGEFTIFTGLPRTHDISAVGQTEIYQIPIKRFRSLYDHEPDISKALLKATLLRMHTLLETIDAMRRLPVIERMAKLLLSMQQNSENTHLIKCRQSELAFTLGISRVSTGKALKQLANLGMIQLGYGQIELSDPSELESWIDQQSNTIQLRAVAQPNG